MPNAVLIPQSGTTVERLGIEYVDGWPEVTHKIETNIGGEPLEDGREVTDHAVARQDRLVLTGWVSDFTSGSGKQRAAWTRIRELHDAVTPLRVVTEWGVYDEMLIDRAEAPQTTRGMRFTLELREIKRVGITDTTLTEDRVSGPAEGRGSGTDVGRVNLGPQTTLEAFQ